MPDIIYYKDIKLDELDLNRLSDCLLDIDKIKSSIFSFIGSLFSNRMSNYSDKIRFTALTYHRRACYHQLYTLVDEAVSFSYKKALNELQNDYSYKNCLDFYQSLVVVACSFLFTAIKAGNSEVSIKTTICDICKDILSDYFIDTNSEDVYFGPMMHIIENLRKTSHSMRDVFKTITHTLCENYIDSSLIHPCFKGVENVIAFIMQNFDDSCHSEKINDVIKFFKSLNDIKYFGESDLNRYSQNDKLLGFIDYPIEEEPYFYLCKLKFDNNERKTALDIIKKRLKITKNFLWISRYTLLGSIGEASADFGIKNEEKMQHGFLEAMSIACILSTNNFDIINIQNPDNPKIDTETMSDSSKEAIKKILNNNYQWDI